MTLSAVVLPPHYPPGNDADVWDVYLADGINPGKHVACARSREDANRTCAIVAMQHRARAVLWRRGDVL